MRKRFTKNVQTVFKKVKKGKQKINLEKINSFLIIENIASHKNCFGKIILDSLELDKKQIIKEKDRLKKTKTPIPTALDLIKSAAHIAYLSKSSYIGTEHLVYGFVTLTGYLNRIIEKDKSEIDLPVVNEAGKDLPNLPPISPIETPQETRELRKDSFQSKRGDFENNNDSIQGRGPIMPDFLSDINAMVNGFFAPQNHRGRNQNGKSLLKSYSVNLSKKIKDDHKLIGRKKELERISHILNRKMKNNPVLVGEPGVGKTAIVEGLAKKIKKGFSSYHLSGKNIHSLDLGLLVAGTTFRGEFEARLKEIIKEAKNSPNVILFIDEIHNLIGAGNVSGSMDAANILKPALSRGEIQVIGATTFDEYQKHIEKDSALERRFQPILVNEPTITKTEKILEGIKSNYEKYHNVTIEKEANVAAAKLAKKFITDRHLPDSAIDLIDETAARLRSQVSSNKLYEKLTDARKRFTNLISQKEEFVMTDQYEEAIKIRKEEKLLNKKIEQFEKSLEKFEKDNPIIVKKEDILKTLSVMTNIPEEIINQNEKSIAENVKKVFAKNLVGQKDVSKEIFNTLLRKTSGIANTNRPMGSFLFAGPTGTGKTLSAKLLAKALSPENKNALVQINMSEFSERHTASRLLGAPAGYVGYEEEGELSEKVRRNPYSVVLFDEIEKSDPSVLNILLQILEEGEMTNSKGKKINFRNTIVILTSNIGTSELDQASEIGFKTGKKEPEKKTRETVREQIEESLPPELIDRLDKIFIFDSLTEKDIAKIVRTEVARLEKKLKEKDVTLVIDKKIEKHLTQKSMSPRQGARLVRKVIQDELEPLIAKKLLGKKKVKKIEVGLKNGKLTIEK